MIRLFSVFALVPWALGWLLLAPVNVTADDKASAVQVVSDLAYKSGDSLNDYERDRCKLDLYLPAKRPGFACLVWFHGGGLTAGSKDEKFTTNIVHSLANAGLIVASVNYRLSPKATYPAYIDDAAAAIAWVHGHIAEYGGDPKKLYVAGHSAGAYLTAMVGLDPQYLRHYGMDLTDLAGLIPVSGQMMTHFTVRKERGLNEKLIIADEAAPIYHVRKDAPPMLILMGDHDWPARAEENLYFVAAMKVAGNSPVIYRQIADRTHGSIAGQLVRPSDPGRKAILEFIRNTPAKPPASPQKVD